MLAFPCLVLHAIITTSREGLKGMVVMYHLLLAVNDPGAHHYVSSVTLSHTVVTVISCCLKTADVRMLVRVNRPG